MGFALVLVLALVGFLFIIRGTAVQHVRGVGADGIPVSPSESQFPLSVTLLTGTVLSGGNCVEIALNGDGTFPLLWDDLRAARQSILVQNYLSVVLESAGFHAGLCRPPPGLEPQAAPKKQRPGDFSPGIAPPGLEPGLLIQRGRRNQPNPATCNHLREFVSSDAGVC
jgi:hypothetical protein